MELAESHLDNIKALKSAILQSRYRAAALVNKELLSLYFAVGKFISQKIEEEKWGAKVIENLSADLQVELPGLRGFSATNMKRMRLFFESWQEQTVIRPTVSAKLQIIDLEEIKFRPTVSAQLEKSFFGLSFSHHLEIIQGTQKIEERIFYIQKTASEFWSLSTLKNHLNNQTFQKTGSLPNNFLKTITNDEARQKALQSFKDEYLLDFINIEDNDEKDERVLESEIVQNIKKFLMSLGSDFAFIGNQYRLIIEDEEYFLDLLFFNRRLQCLVVFELKTGKFKPEYMGKMNFYLSALDEYVKQPHEQPSIGIILCKEKKNKIVEFSFRDFNKAMGVSTYKTSHVLPAAYKGVLPDVETLKKLMD
ncbi:PDDEXK nuclease domain-containing protein [Pedobacter sp. MC2016-05]|uniref:PDDEXK nuclease domain-containing protein n=1 Tax=Pedobacter sp. MC2016-05 TaxID=2994474 RepID=UPI002246CF2E|nr:PDDEXK nuclease domain-containing protein [Pedobacter sp. MC2016-05]MCX2473135.1 PDDEXK nuclease domain-containing protein [Pedobacter sp. MC2016-05]